jgi:hypothetical protein
MTQDEHAPYAGESPQPASTVKTDVPPERLVRHCFWKYPVISLVLLVVVALLAGFVGSPNWPKESIAGVTKDDPGGAILAFTQELDGTSSSSGNAQEYGMGDPGQIFVLNPLRQAAPLLNSSALQQAIATYDAASPDQRQSWASNYEKALGTQPRSRNISARSRRRELCSVTAKERRAGRDQ